MQMIQRKWNFFSSPTYTGMVPGKVYGTNDEGETGYRSDPLTNNQNQDKAPREYPPTPEYLFSDAAANDSDTAERNEGAAVKKAKPQMKSIQWTTNRDETLSNMR